MGPSSGASIAIIKYFQIKIYSTPSCRVDAAAAGLLLGLRDWVIIR